MWSDSHNSVIIHSDGIFSLEALNACRLKLLMGKEVNKVLILMTIYVFQLIFWSMQLWTLRNHPSWNELCANYNDCEPLTTIFSLHRASEVKEQNQCKWGRRPDPAWKTLGCSLSNILSKCSAWLLPLCKAQLQLRESASVPRKQCVWQWHGTWQMEQVITPVWKLNEGGKAAALEISFQLKCHKISLLLILIWAFRLSPNF